MITICVPFIDNEEITKRCIKGINDNSVGPIELIVIDNGSDKVQDFSDVLTNEDISFKYIRNEKNIGGPLSFRQGIDASASEIVCIIHNDVLIHESGWNTRVENYFNEDYNLGLAGFFGASMVAPDGGRGGSKSNMLGLEWGSAWNHHGDHLTDIAPAAVLDGVAMIFRKSYISKVEERHDLFSNDRPPHHWYDRHIVMCFIDAGYRVATFGIGFDHWSGATANSSEKYRMCIRRWILSHMDNQYVKKTLELFMQTNQKPEENLDAFVYVAGRLMWEEQWSPRLTLHVDENYNYYGDRW